MKKKNIYNNYDDHLENNKVDDSNNYNHSSRFYEFKNQNINQNTINQTQSFTKIRRHSENPKGKNNARAPSLNGIDLVFKIYKKYLFKFLFYALKLISSEIV